MCSRKGQEDNTFQDSPESIYFSVTWFQKMLITQFESKFLRGNIIDTGFITLKEKKTVFGECGQCGKFLRYLPLILRLTDPGKCISWTSHSCYWFIKLGRNTRWFPTPRPLLLQHLIKSLEFPPWLECITRRQFEYRLHTSRCKAKKVLSQKVVMPRERLSQKVLVPGGGGGSEPKSAHAWGDT